MRNHSEIPLGPLLKSLHCPRCRRLLARVDRTREPVLEIRCPRCKAFVHLNDQGIYSEERDLTITVQ